MNNAVADSTTEKKVDNQSEGSGAIESLLRLVADALIFRSAEGHFRARVPVNGRREILGLRTAAFRDWLADAYLSEYRALPSEWAVRRVLRALEARARFGADTPPVYVRVGRDQDDDEQSYYLDLGDPSGQAIKICASGWSVVDRPGVYFERPQGLLALPEPSRAGSIELLRPFVNLSDSDFHLLIAWMAAALRPEGPYPILAVHGEQGSAKSTLAKVVRQLVDPQTAPLLAEPRSTRDLIVTAVNGWLLAIDNVSVLPGWLSDSLCRLASGGGFAARALYSNDDRKVIYAQRPVILNGIEDFVRRGDLVDRGVFLRLPPINPEARRAEAEFWESFKQLKPQILGGLLDALVGALRELPLVRLTKLPRMADFARLGEAVGRGMGWPPETFLSAYFENRREASASSLEDSLIASSLLFSAKIGGLMNWTLPPAKMLDSLTRGLDRREAASARWPKTPAMLTNELRRLAPQLREQGICVTFTRNSNGRFITVNAWDGGKPWSAK